MKLISNKELIQYIKSGDFSGSLSEVLYQLLIRIDQLEQRGLYDVEKDKLGDLEIN